MALVIKEGVSSSSFTHQPKNFHVFLSFRGQDTRHGFISHLYEALRLRGIHTFIDDKLPRGEQISVELLKIIENSTILIIVFSENYASSTWCLDELAKIVECKKNGQLVQPVFYKVDPSELCKQNGKFGKALAKHEKNIKDYMKLQRWRNALQEATNMSGWHYKHSSSKFKFIQGIVEEISNSKLNLTPLSVARYPVGINHRVKIILSNIDSNDAHMIGIYGPAGIDQYDKLLMHDFLQQMAKDIVRRESPQLPGERSRLWCYEDVLDVVTENTGSKKIRGIMICSPESSKIQLEAKCLKKMKNLKFLIVSNVEICGDLEYLPNGLRVLDWSGFPLSSLLSNLHPKNLTILNIPESRVIMYKLLKRIQCKSLTYMNFQSCQYIRELPDLSIASPNIKQLDLRECIKLAEVHDSNGCLDKLESWDLTGCVELQIIPSFIRMKSLKFLILYECKRVKRFPNIPEEMENLKFLSLAYTAIRVLPSSFGNLIGIERLDLGSYFHSCHLPSSIYKLQYLRKLVLHGHVQFPKDVEIGRQALCNSYGGFSKYGFVMLNFIKKLTSCFNLVEKCLLSRSENLNFQDGIMRFNGLNFLLIEDSKFLKKIPKLPESIRSVYVANCISLNSQSLTKLFLQFGRNLGVAPNMKCSGVKCNVLVDSHSHQIDYSSQLPLSKFFLIEEELRPTLDAYLIDFGERYNIIVPEKKIPKWFNHQSIESSISFWVGPKFPTFAFCIAFHLVPLKDSYANNDKCGSLLDDIISWICVVNIFINGHKRPFMQQPIFQYLKCDHLWFYGVPHSQLQQKFGDLMQGDRNHIEVSCKISHWASEFGNFAPVIARIGAHVECICPLNSIIIHNNYATLTTLSLHLYNLLSAFDGSHINHASLSRLRRKRTSTSSNP